MWAFSLLINAIVERLLTFDTSRPIPAHRMHLILLISKANKTILWKEWREVCMCFLAGSWSDEWRGCHESWGGISQGLVQTFSVPDSLPSIWNFIISPWTPPNTQLAPHLGYIVLDTSLTLQCQIFLLQSKRKNRDLSNLWVTGSSLDIFFILQTSNGSIRYFIENLCFIFPHFHRPHHQHQLSKGEKDKEGRSRKPCITVSGQNKPTSFGEEMGRSCVCRHGGNDWGVGNTDQWLFIPFTRTSDNWLTIKTMMRLKGDYCPLLGPALPSHTAQSPFSPSC